MGRLCKPQMIACRGNICATPEGALPDRRKRKLRSVAGQVHKSASDKLDLIGSNLFPCVRL
jgi:hypothetical protein